MRSVLHVTSCLAALCLLSQCSVPYQLKHRKIALTQGTTLENLEGAWVGTWRSEKSGHHGKLKAIVTRQDVSQNPNLYTFHYHATWAGVISGRFKTYHSASPSQKAGSQWQIEGKHALPWYYGGLYTYQGQANPTQFQSRYECRYDTGYFVLKRPE